MSTTTVNNKIKLLTECSIRQARLMIIKTFEEEMKTTDSKELKEALMSKITDMYEYDLVFDKPRTINRVLPTGPVKVRGTTLTLKNIPNENNYRKFCAAIAEKLNYQSDFSDSPFKDYPKNTRIYEAIKSLYRQHDFTQDDLDEIVNFCE